MAYNDRKPKQNGYQGKKQEGQPHQNRNDNRRGAYDNRGASDNRRATYGREPLKKRPMDRNFDREEPRDATFRDTEAYEGFDAQKHDESAAEGLVIGRNAVRELLRSDRTVDKLLVRRGDREGSIVVLVAEAIEKNIPVVEVDKSKLDAMAGFVPHQGVIAMVAQKEYCTVEDILAIAQERGEPPLIAIADGITDPYNLGALIRCAEGVGAHGLIIPKRRAVGLTALVAKSSAGAMEHLAVAKVANIANTIRELKDKGVWVYCAEAGGAPYYETNFKGPCALVFGSEGNGVSRVVTELCDGIVSIPMYGHVNSFNVSTAAAVLLAEASRQHREGKADV